MPRPQRLWIDLETRSSVDLRKATPYRYAEDTNFLILMGSYATDVDPTVRDVEGQEELLDLVGEWLLDPGVVKVAHNAPFERICLSRAMGFGVGEYLEPEPWHDTQAVAGALGYPQKLALLGPALGSEHKDEAGTLLINWFCKPTKDGDFRKPEDHPEKWAAFVRYCNQDVVVLKEVDRKLQELGGWPTEMERSIYIADQRINDIGLPIDVLNVSRAARAVVVNNTQHEAELSAITGLAKPNNPSTLREWIANEPTWMGARLRLPDLRAETVEDRLDKLNEIGEPQTDLRRALELRRELAGTASKKFAAALYGVSSDGRIRGSFRYFGAHTGRWSGRGAQPQNLPRHTFEHEPDVELALDDLASTGKLSPDELKRLVRAMFTGPSVGKKEDLTVVDFSSIEARFISWLAGEQWAIEAFTAGRDIYVETAERMGGLTRAQGKIAVLALGYAGGSNSLREMSGPGDDFINLKSDEELWSEIVDPWRKANPAIVRFWSDIEEAFAEGTGSAGLINVTRSSNSLGESRHLWLPSGRAISYHGVRKESWVVPVKEKVLHPETGRQVVRTRYVKKKGWRYADPRSPFNPNQRIPTYGGRLAENVTQGGARDVEAEALVHLLENGYRPVGHVHDEILTEGGDLSGVERVITRSPEWAIGLPIDGEGFTCRRYKKG